MALPAIRLVGAFMIVMLHRSLLLLEAFSPLRKTTNPLGTPVLWQLQGRSISGHPPRPMLEVEEKFAWTGTDVGEVEERLIRAGFVKDSSFEMVDWYFDTTQPYTLTIRDCWLRYRQTSSKHGIVSGCWQLKRGVSSSGTPQQQRRTTVYDETEGVDAVILACSIVQENMDPQSPSSSSSVDASPRTEDIFEGHKVPELPPVASAPHLTPVARIATQRCHWRVPSDAHHGRHTFASLGVDLDTTDFGHTVGEVEAVVESEHQVSEARELIRQFLQHVVYSNTSVELRQPAQGKLEYYLERYRPDLYESLIKAGIMKRGTLL